MLKQRYQNTCVASYGTDGNYDLASCLSDLTVSAGESSDPSGYTCAGIPLRIYTGVRHVHLYSLFIATRSQCCPSSVDATRTIAGWVIVTGVHTQLSSVYGLDGWFSTWSESLVFSSTMDIMPLYRNRHSEQRFGFRYTSELSHLLGGQLDANTPMSPRQAINSAPYAHQVLQKA